MTSVSLQDNPSPERRYPWNGEFDLGKANTGETGIGVTSAVGCFPAGASPYGVQDLSGNVWEWTRSLFKKYPYDAGDGREKLDDPGARVLRGGAFYDNHGWVRCAFRFWYFPYFRYYSIGFRVVVSPSAAVR